ncbi:MAG: S8 family serine peptidase, partial [Adhaeribacter sp.]
SQETEYWELNTQGRSANMRLYNSYDGIPAHSGAKNILTAGAISPLNNGYSQPGDVVDYVASSYGPTDDGRIKPDLVGSGINVTSTFSGTNTSYGRATGTSMAAPNITGSLLLLQQHYANLHGGAFMRSSTLKALALHTTQEAGKFPGPDYIFGWGVLDSDEAARVISGSGVKDLLSERVLQQDSTYTRTIIASGTEPLRVTICWTDPKGPVLPLDGPSALNNRSPMLINDLDISLQLESSTFLPWVLDPDNPAAPATTGDNFRDNVEQVFIAQPQPGAAYTLTLRHKNLLTNGSQPYALVISGMAGPAYPASAPAGSSQSRIESLQFGTLLQNHGLACGGYADHTQQVTHLQAGATMPLTLTLQNCGAAQVDKAAKVFIDWNEDGDFGDAGENVLTTDVFSGMARITGQVSVPDYVRVGNSSRMRVVMAETSDGSLVSSDQSYAAGETQDYTVAFVRHAKDAGIVGLSIPTPTTLWANTAQSLTVRIRNFDALPLSQVPVSVTVRSGATLIATLTGTYNGTLQPLEEASFTLPGTFPVSAATTYDFTASTLLGGDQDQANNTLVTVMTSSTAGEAPAISALACAENPQASLKGSGTGTLIWFDAAAGGNRIGIGPQVTTPFKPADNTYYAALNEFSGTSLTLFNSTPGSLSALENDTIYFNASADLVLDRVSIQVGAAGPATVRLLRPDGTLLDSVQLNLVAGTAEYGLNFVVPASDGAYGLMISRFCSGATARRQDGAGTLAFPYSTPGVITITGTASGGAYLYNWKYRIAGSPSARKAVKANGLVQTTMQDLCAGGNAGSLSLSQFHGAIARWEQSTGQGPWTALADTSATLAFRNLADTTRFRAVLRWESCSQAYSDPITLLVKPAPLPSLTAPEGSVLCPGSPLPLVASGGTRYLWSTGDTTQQILVARPGTYTVQIRHENGCPATDSLSFTAKPVAWTGQADSDWFNAANWDCQVPDSATDVHIPAGLENYPAIGAGEAACRDLYIQGTLSLSGGSLQVKGNFRNEGSYHHPQGTVVLASAGNQQVSGGNFYNLTVESPGITTLGSDITVSGALVVAQGRLQTGSHQVNLGPEATLAESDTHYITGKVSTTRTFDASQQEHTFGGLGLRIATAAAPGDIQVVRSTGIAPGKTAIQRAYGIHVLPPGQNDNLNATLDFYYFSHELNNLEKDYLALFRSVDSGATWTLQEQSLADTARAVHKVSLSGIRAFSDWTLADRISNTTLPVQLLSFQARRSGPEVVLTWETAMEVNHAGMAVEVSSDASNYRLLRFIPAAERDVYTRQQYRFVDTEAHKSGLRYYRLRQEDRDGKKTYYGPRVVSFELAGPGMRLYPNPADGRLQILAPAQAAGVLELEIKNASGQAVWHTRKPLQKGRNLLELDLRHILKPGLYVVLGRYDNQVFPMKLVIQ